MSKKTEKRIVRQIRKEKRVVLRPTPRRENPRPARRFVPRAPPARRVFVRRGRGDVWMQTRGGKWVDVNDRGTFKYLEDNKIGLTIDVQFTKRGKGTVISAVSISAKDNKILALSDGSIELNGVTVRGRKGKGAIFDFEGDSVKVFKFKTIGTFEIRGLHNERFSFEYEKETQSYMIVVGTIAAHHVGLFADPRHAKKYQIAEEDSPFERYVEFQVVKPLRPTRRQRKAAKTCCKKLTGVKRRECRSDYYRVGKCLHYYTHKKPSLN